MNNNEQLKKLNRRPVEYSKLQLPDAEEAALGAILLEPSAAPGLLRKLDKSMFADLRNQRIYEAMRILNADSVVPDEAALIQKLKKDGKEALDEAGGVCHVTSLVDKIESVANFSHYQNQLKDYSGRRAIFQHGHELLCMIGDAHLESSDILKKFNENVSRTLKQSISGRSLIQLVNPVEAVKYVPDEGVLLVGDQHIIRGSITVIGGAAGIGKSRAATALAVAGVTQQDWFGLTVHTQFKTLIIQAENGPTRLRSEYYDLPVEDMRDFVRISYPPRCGLAFDDPKFQAAILEHCEEFDPDVIIIDPWNRATSGDTQQDYSEAFENILRSLPNNPPATIIIAHTKKPRDGENKMGRETLHELSGSHILGSAPRSVFVMKAASNDPQNNRVVWQNPKNNDGQMSKKSAWHRKNGLFAPCPDFDWNGYENSSDKQTKCTIDALETVFKSGDGKLERKFAAEQLGEITGLGKSACYNALKPDGKFADYIAQDGDLLVWVDSQETQIPLSNSTST
jgi:hypothetical protein